MQKKTPSHILIKKVKITTETKPETVTIQMDRSGFTMKVHFEAIKFNVMVRSDQHNGTKWPEGRYEMTRECYEKTRKRYEKVGYETSSNLAWQGRHQRASGPWVTVPSSSSPHTAHNGDTCEGQGPPTSVYLCCLQDATSHLSPYLC